MVYNLDDKHTDERSNTRPWRVETVTPEETGMCAGIILTPEMTGRFCSDLLALHHKAEMEALGMNENPRETTSDPLTINVTMFDELAEGVKDWAEYLDRVLREWAKILDEMQDEPNQESEQFVPEPDKPRRQDYNTRVMLARGNTRPKTRWSPLYGKR